MYEGARVRPDETPATLGMEDGDQIDAHIEQVSRCVPFSFLYIGYLGHARDRGIHEMWSCSPSHTPSLQCTRDGASLLMLRLGLGNFC